MSGPGCCLLADVMWCLLADCCVVKQGSSFVNACTGRALIMSNGLDYCLRLLKILLDYWKTHLASKEVFCRLFLRDYQRLATISVIIGAHLLGLFCLSSVVISWLIGFLFQEAACMHSCACMLLLGRESQEARKWRLRRDKTIPTNEHRLSHLGFCLSTAIAVCLNNSNSIWRLIFFRLWDHSSLSLLLGCI